MRYFEASILERQKLMQRIQTALVLLMLLSAGCSPSGQMATPKNTNDSNSTASPASAELADGGLLGGEHLAKYRADNSEVGSLVEFANINLTSIMDMLEGSPEEAKSRIVAMRDELMQVETPSRDARGVMMEIQDSLDMLADRLAIMKLPLQEIRDSLNRDPNDAAAVKKYSQKIQYEASKLMDEDLDGAMKYIEGQVDFIEISFNRSTENGARIAYSQLGQSVNELANRILQYQEFEKMIGQPMASIDANAWVNGEALTDEELRGKVVLIDFWAIWCGPCIMSFPHLVEWQEKYGEDGLQIVGITQYYNFAWPEDSESPVEAEYQVPPKEEQKVLDRLAKHFKLKHPTAIVPQDSPLMPYYAQSGLPHMVLIGRDGKIKRIEMGISGPLVQEIDQQIQDLLDETAPANPEITELEKAAESLEPAAETESPQAMEKADSTQETTDESTSEEKEADLSDTSGKDEAKAEDQPEQKTEAKPEADSEPQPESTSEKDSTDAPEAESNSEETSEPEPAEAE